METSLHRELKSRYAPHLAQTEVRLGRYRIDAVVGEELVEVQHGSLAAIRDKIRHLLEQHRVRIVKPVIRTKYLVKHRRRGGAIVDRRQSPKRGTFLDLFGELVYFTRTFPHPRLAIEALLVDVEEHRYPGHGRRRRRRLGDFQVEDQLLLTVHQSLVLRTPADLTLLAEHAWPKKFHTAQLAAALDVSRAVAQRMAYCLREMGAARVVGKSGNAWLYELAADAAPRRRGAKHRAQRPAQPPAKSERSSPE